MANPYPIPGGYRKGSPGRSPAGSQRRPLPRPGYNPTPVRPPIPGPGNAWRWGGLAARGLPKLIPILGGALAAYELYRWYKSLDPNLAGYTVCYQGTVNECAPSNFWEGEYRYTVRADCSPVSMCFVSANEDPFQFGRQPYIAQARATDVFGVGPNGNVFSSIFRIWHRIAGLETDPGVVTQGVPAPVEVPIPDRAPNRDPSPLDHPAMNPWTPWFDPMAIPLHEPQPVPVAPPYPSIPVRPVNRPDRDPVEQPTRGPLPRPRPDPMLGPRPHPWNQVWPRQERRLGPKYHRSRPPGPGVKEKKLIGNPKPDSWIQWGLNAATEGADWVECIHSGLPKNMQAKRGATPQDQAAAIYRGVNNIDWMQVIKACAINQVIDYIGGKVGKAEARMNRKFGLTGGTFGRTRGNIGKNMPR